MAGNQDQTCLKAMETHELKDPDAMRWSGPGPCRSPLTGRARLCADMIGPRRFGQPSSTDLWI